MSALNLLKKIALTVWAWYDSEPTAADLARRDARQASYRAELESQRKAEYARQMRQLSGEPSDIIGASSGFERSIVDLFKLGFFIAAIAAVCFLVSAFGLVALLLLVLIIPVVLA